MVSFAAAARAAATRTTRAATRRSFATDALGTRPGDSWRGRARFYERVDVVPVEREGWSVALDGRALRTPGKRSFWLPSRALATAVGLEWDAQIKVLETSTMPLTMLSAVAIDVTPTRREATVDELMRYGTTDLVCFPLSMEDAVEQEHLKLVERQQKCWAKPLQHVRSAYGEVAMCDARSLGAPAHPAETRARMRHRLERMSDWDLTSTLSLAQASKSLIIPLALLDGAISVAEALEAARVEEEHQIAHWGLVEGGHDVDHANTRVQMLAAALLHRMTV